MILYAHTRSCNAIGLCRYGLMAALLLSLNVFTFSEMFAAAAPVKSAVPPMTLSQVVDTLVARNVERARDLRSYEGRRTYSVVYRGFPDDLNATMVVDVNYEAPDTKQFKITSQSGPKWLVDRVLKRLVKSETDAQRDQTRRAVDLNQTNYTFSDLEYQPAADGCSYVVTVEPRKPNKYLYRGKIWINDRDFAVCRIQAQPAKNPSFWITSTSIAQTYEKMGEFWLPQKNKSVSSIRLGGRATLTIQYQDYKLPPPIDAAQASLTSAPGK